MRAKAFKSDTGFSCRFCAPADDADVDICAMMKDGLTCTREQGHEGQHVACTSVKRDHVCGFWPQEKSK